MKTANLFKLVLVVALVAAPADMCGQGLLKKLGQGLQKVLAPTSNTNKPKTTTTRTPQLSKPSIIINTEHKDIVDGDLLIRPYGENPSCDIQFVMARREGALVNVYFYLHNRNVLPVNGVRMRNYGENAVTYANATQQKNKVLGLKMGTQSNASEVLVNIPANTKMMGCVSIDGKEYSMATSHVGNININFSAVVDGAEKQFGFLLSKAPLTQFIMKKGGFPNFDFTQPISQFPKSVFGLYDNFTTETSYNEVEDYEETYVTFTLGGNKVMEGVSDNEGEVKVLSSLTGLCPLFFSERGVYPGMTIEKAYAAGAKFWREGWFEGIYEPGCWMQFEGPGWTTAGMQKYQKAAEDYENRQNYSENAKWKGNILATDFKPGTYISSITIYF